MENFTIHTDNRGNFAASFDGIFYALKGDWSNEMNDDSINKEVECLSCPSVSLDKFFGFANIENEEYDDVQDAYVSAIDMNMQIV